MSIQIQISAFKLPEFKKHLGGANAGLEKEAIEAFEDLSEEVDLEEDQVEDGIERIKKLIKSGKTGSVETIAEVSAVNTIVAKSDQSLGDDGEMEWPWSELSEMQRQLAKRFDPQTKQLFNYFVEGRPLIGQKFDEEAGFYLYLTSPEVEQLRAGLEQVYAATSEIVDSGAMNEQDFDGGLVDSLENFMLTLGAVQCEDKDLFAISC
ncbi:MAG TPA: hypothetical protein V6C81_07115 [Planktothrix sp.]|jgi:hypothetical protein